MTKVSGEAPAHLKRFFETVSVKESGGAYAIFLDDRPAKTRCGAPLATRTKILADAVAEEWRSDYEFVVMEKMPLTRLLMTAIDCGERDRAGWADTIVSFLRSDLLCYRAEKPRALVDRQEKAWDRYLSWARDKLGVKLNRTAGVTFVEQPPEAINVAQSLLADARTGTVLCLRMITEQTGSAVLALVVWKGDFAQSEIFAASRIDEHFQREQWGEDEEATAREASIREDFDAACRFLSLAGD